jgi:ferredoxin
MTKRLKVVVDRDLCDSHGVCVANAPSVFEIGDDDQMRILVPTPSDEQLEAVHAAVRGCPKGALSLLEED